MGGAHDLYCCYSHKNLHKNIIIFDNPSTEEDVGIKSQIKSQRWKFLISQWTLSSKENCNIFIPVKAMQEVTTGRACGRGRTRTRTDLA